MDYQQHVEQQFNHSIAAKQGAAANLTPAIVEASEIITAALLQGKKILSCGVAGSGSLSQYFACTLLNRYERERPGLPAVALNADSQMMSTIASDHAFRDIFSKQIKVLGNEGDILLTLSSNGSARTAVEAVIAAHDKDIRVIALTGKNSGSIAEALNETDLEICVPVQSIARIQEVHLLILHSLCNLIDLQIFGEE